MLRFKKCLSVLIVLMFVFLLFPISVHADDGNQTYHTATPINVNQTYERNLANIDDTNWYKFSLNEAGYVTVNFHQTSGSRLSEYTYYVDIVGIDSFGGEGVYYRKAIPGSALNNTLASIGLPKGTYYIRIGWYGGWLFFTSKPYYLTVNFTKSSTWEKEWNGAWDGATTISVDTSYHGTLHSEGDKDWYKFSLNEAGHVAVNFQHTYNSDSKNSYYRVYLKSYNVLTGEETTLTSIEVPGNSRAAMLAITHLPRGTHYIQVEAGRYWTEAPYSIRVFKSGAPLKINRFEGDNRYKTAIIASQNAYPSGASTVILASGENFPDALSGSVLAYRRNAPLLITRKASIDNDVLTEISRLEAKKVFILGGPEAVSEAVANKLRARGLTVERIAGNNRYATATKIAQTVGMNATREVFLVNAHFYADALSIGPVAARRGIPILLTGTASLNQETKKYLIDNRVSQVTIIGGESAVSRAVENELKRFVKVERVAGASRYDTAIEIAAKYYPKATHYLIATGQNFPDGLVGGYYGAKYSAPIILVTDKAVRDSVKNYMRNASLEVLTVLGGKVVVSDAVVDLLTAK